MGKQALKFLLRPVSALSLVFPVFGVVAACGFGLVWGCVVSQALPDGRAYEAVSPVASEGSANVYVPAGGKNFFSASAEHGIYTSRPFQVAPGGEAVAYAGDPPAVGGGGQAGAGNGASYVARRSSGGGWQAQDVQPPEPFSVGPAYVAFSSDLSVGILSGPEALAANAPEGDFFAHATRGGGEGEYAPFYTGAQSPGGVSQPLFAGANAGAPGVGGFSHLAFESEEDLLEGEGALERGVQEAVVQVGEAQVGVLAEAAKLKEEERFGEAGKKRAFAERGEVPHLLYDSVGGRLTVVNVLPDGKVAGDASFGSFAPHPPTLPSHGPGLDRVVSGDGSRVFWSDGEPVEQEEGERVEQRVRALYVRENDTAPQSPVGGEGECLVAADACTVQVDASALLGTLKEKEEKGGSGTFLTASSDGSRVFFSDEKQLTEGSTAAAEKPDLYECELPAGGGACRLTDLTVDEHAGEAADVQGVLGSSEYGEYVYFVAHGVLAGNQTANGESAKEGGDNLYLYHEGATTFIAGLSPQDGTEVIPFDEYGEAVAGDWQAAVAYRTAQVSPDGRSVVFMSNRRLTGYDNELTAPDPLANPAGKVETWRLDEVFDYEAAGGAGVLRCVSCNPSGQPPVATNFNKEYTPTGGNPLGGYFPITLTSGYQAPPRVISDDGGRVFFDSGEPLTPQDTNGWLGVYEWERDGTGTCTQSQGCTYLISGGTDPENSYLIGASETGGDVFFLTRAQLVAADKNDNDDVYDAHECTAAVPCSHEAPSTCTGTGCQGVPLAPPIFATPASGTFAGVGNFPPPPPPKKVTKKTVKMCQGEHLSHNKCRKTKHKKKSRKANKTNPGTHR
jgi:hypothetical protein